MPGAVQRDGRVLPGGGTLGADAAASGPGGPLAPFAAFEEPGNELREAYLARMTQDEHRNG